MGGVELDQQRVAQPFADDRVGDQLLGEGDGDLAQGGRGVVDRKPTASDVSLKSERIGVSGACVCYPYVSWIIRKTRTL